MNSIKCVLVGDPASGKTCIIQSFLELSSPNGPSKKTRGELSYHTSSIVPSHSSSHHSSTHSQVMIVDGQPINLQLVDTVGDDSHQRHRHLSYEGAQIVILTFSLIQPDSLENLKTKWLPEIRLYGSSSSLPHLIVLGTKLDLRQTAENTNNATNLSRKFRPVSSEEGRKVAKQLKAQYFECSALTHKGLQEVFHEVLMASTDFIETDDSNVNKKQKKCTIL